MTTNISPESVTGNGCRYCGILSPCPKHARDLFRNQSIDDAIARSQGPMRRVYVCSPLRGDYEGNTKRAREYCDEVARRGHVPYAPHLFFTQFLDDTIAEEREAGIRLGLYELAKSDEVWAFIPPAGPSEGMRREMDLARMIGIPVVAIAVGGAA